MSLLDLPSSSSNGRVVSAETEMRAHEVAERLVLEFGDVLTPSFVEHVVFDYLERLGAAHQCPAELFALIERASRQALQARAAVVAPSRPACGRRTPLYEYPGEADVE